MAADESGRIYTAPDPAASGGLTGRVDAPLSFAVAVDHELQCVFRGALDPDGQAFDFTGMPTGKYDLVLITRDGRLFEGLALGESPVNLSDASRRNLEKRVALADTFFNRYIIHRFGLDGDKLLAFVERIRDKLTFQQSGEKLEANVRRLEVVELDQAEDDWQMVTNRHLLREPEPIKESPPFYKSAFLAGIGNLRVIDTVRDLGIIALKSANP